MTDKVTRRSRGFGFITFENRAEADTALRELNGMELFGREIRVDRTTPKGENRRREGGGGNGENYSREDIRFADRKEFGVDSRGRGRKLSSCKRYSDAIAYSIAFIRLLYFSFLSVR